VHFHPFHVAATRLVCINVKPKGSDLSEVRVYVCYFFTLPQITHLSPCDTTQFPVLCMLCFLCAHCQSKGPQAEAQDCVQQ
jgi:hypothetical protein